MTIEASFQVEGDPVWIKNLMCLAEGKPVEKQTYEVTMTSAHKIPCPSIWRHPIAWLQWNPFMERRMSYTLNGVELEKSTSGSLTFTS